MPCFFIWIGLDVVEVKVCIIIIHASIGGPLKISRSFYPKDTVEGPVFFCGFNGSFFFMESMKNRMFPVHLEKCTY